MADSAVKKAIQRKLYASFSIALQGKYTPLPNNILDTMIADAGLELEDRFDALLDRMSFGNWSLYACRRDWDTGAATIVTQSDFATILKVDKQRINDVVVKRRQQGYLQNKETLPNPRMLARELDPHGARPAPPEKEPRIRWADFSDKWDSEHQDLVKQRAELLAKAAPYLEKAHKIHEQKLNAFKQAQKEEEQVPDSPDNPSATPRTSVRNSPDDPSSTPRTFDARIHKGTRAKINSKRLASGLVIPDEPSQSVGPSAPKAAKTDRPAKPLSQDDEERVREFLVEHLGEWLPHEHPGRSLCLQIASAAGSMPLEETLPLIHRKKKKILESGMGMVLPLVKEVRTRWEAAVHKLQRDRQRQPEVDRARDIQFAHEVLKSPDADESQKAWARDVLGAQVKGAV